MPNHVTTALLLTAGIALGPDAPRVDRKAIPMKGASGSGPTRGMPRIPIAIDGLHGELLFHDGVRFREPLATDVLRDRRVTEIGPFGVMDAPDMRLARDLLARFRAWIIYLPAEPFLPEEIEAIRAYVEAGGGLLLVADNGEVPGRDAASGLAAAFGVRFGRSVVARPRIYRTHVLGEARPRRVPALRFPYHFDAETTDHPAARGIPALPVRAAAPVRGGDPIAVVRPAPPVSDLPATLWEDRCAPLDLRRPDGWPEPEEIAARSVIASAVRRGRGRAIFWGDGLLGRWALEGYGGPALRATVAAFARNAIAWLLGEMPRDGSPHAHHPIPGYPSPEQGIFFRYRLVDLGEAAGRVEASGPGGWHAEWEIAPQGDGPRFHLNTGRASPGAYTVGGRAITVLAGRPLRVRNGDETTPDDWFQAARREGRWSCGRVERYMRRQAKHFGMNHMADFPCPDPLAACQIAAGLGLEMGTIYHGWMLKPVGSLGGPRRERLFVFRSLPVRYREAETVGLDRAPSNGIVALWDRVGTPGFLFWNAGGGNEPTMAYVDGTSPVDLAWYRRQVARWGYRPADLGVASWDDVRPHPLVDSHLDVSGGNVNPVPDRVLRPAWDARRTPIAEAPGAPYLSWTLSNRAACRILWEKSLSTLRLFAMFFPEAISLGAHEADWPYFFGNIIPARAGHWFIPPAEVLGIHAMATPMTALTYQCGYVVEIEEARLPRAPGRWIRFKQFSNDFGRDLVAANEYLENAYATALAHGAAMFGYEKTHQMGRPEGPRENRAFLARANALSPVWLESFGRRARVAAYLSDARALRGVLPAIFWGWVAAVRGLGGAPVDLLFPWNLRAGDLDRYEALLLFGADCLEPWEARAIAGWTERGGLLLADANAGRWDLAFGERFLLAEVFGAIPSGVPRDADGDVLRIHPRLPGASASIEPLRARMEEDLWELRVRASGTEIAGRYADGTPAIARHRFGRGEAILWGFYAGHQERYAGHHPALEAFLGAAVRLRSEPDVSSDAPDADLGLWDGGEARYLVAVAHIPPPPATDRMDREVLGDLERFGPVDATIALRGTWDVVMDIDGIALDRTRWRVAVRREGGRTRFRARIPRRDHLVYALFPPGGLPASVAVRVEPERVERGARVLVSVRVHVRGDVPVALRAGPEGGAPVYRRRLFARAGSARWRLDLAPNDPPGAWTVTAAERVTGREGRAALAVR